MQGLHGNQRKILDFLIDVSNGATLDEIATHLEISKSAAKEHIVRLEKLGFLTFKDERGFIGRPKRRYFIADNGRDVFPKQYSWFSNILLEFLTEDMGQEAVSNMMSDLADKIAGSMKEKFEATRTPAERLSLIASTLSDLGYRAALKQSDIRKGAILEATNCVYHSVAMKNPSLCRFDTRFIEQASGGMNVQLEKCIARGDGVCRFCIKKR